MLLLLATPFLSAPVLRSAELTELRVFAAASLQDALQVLGNDYERASGLRVRFSFAATSVLARQIENGARADLIISADTEWIDYLDQRQLLRSDTRRNLLGNTLVLIAPANSTVKLRIAPGFNLVGALGATGRLALADPAGVPAGKYARAALTQLGTWPSVANRLVLGDSVRTALAFVARGEAPLGIVYASDALIDQRVRVVDKFSAGLHPPLVYPLAITSNAQAGAAEFQRYLQQPAALKVFVSFGFSAPPTNAPAP